MLDAIKKVYTILTAREVRKFIVLMLVIFVMGFFELAGIASIMPFMQLVSQPDAIENSRLLTWGYNTLGFASNHQFLFALGVLVLVLLTTANALTVFAIWLQHKFAWDSANAIANRLLKKYLNQPYHFFLSQNSSQLVKQILSETNDLANGFLLSVAVLIAKAFVALVIFSLLLMVDPFLAITIFVVFGSIYVLTYTMMRRYLTRLGTVRFAANEQRYKTATEAFAGIKMVKMGGKERYFGRRFQEASAAFCQVEPKREATFVTPVYLVQTLAFGAILLLILYLLATERGLQDVIPLLSLYALAGYRLLPSLQQMYSSIARIRYQRPIVDAIYHDLIVEGGALAPAPAGGEPMAFKRSIEIKEVAFKYPAAEDYALRDVSLEIQKNQQIAFVGSTGSGKSTLVDLAIGLLRPVRGGIYVDGVAMDETNSRAWQDLIGYVPQEVALYDDTLIRNIAFGIDAHQVDRARIEEVARIANIHDFIVDELPEGYETCVGERGVRLSGGQRQRIGLARALYQRPAVLVLDEATSALDGITEAAVMEGIRSALEEVTIIMIAHRLDTVKDCDYIFMMEQGQIVSSGTYDDLVQQNDVFRKMARIEPVFDRSRVMN